MFTVNDKDTRTTRSNVFILNFEQLSHLVLVLQLLTLNRFLAGKKISQTKSLQIKSFLPFNLAITKISVPIRLAEDGTRMGDI